MTARGKPKGVRMWALIDRTGTYATCAWHSRDSAVYDRDQWWSIDAKRWAIVRGTFIPDPPRARKRRAK